jgi:hypothetical protein
LSLTLNAHVVINLLMSALGRYNSTANRKLTESETQQIIECMQAALTKAAYDEIWEVT